MGIRDRTKNAAPIRLSVASKRDLPPKMGRTKGAKIINSMHGAMSGSPQPGDKRVICA
jgi:hypothetical protein